MESGEPLSALLIDIDHFKSFNDNYGHQVGDQVIKLMAAVLREHVREHDLAARYGGEELIAVLPGTDLEACRQFAERIRGVVAEQRIRRRTTGEEICLDHHFGRRRRVPPGRIRRKPDRALRPRALSRQAPGTQSRADRTRPRRRHRCGLRRCLRTRQSTLTYLAATCRRCAIYSRATAIVLTQSRVSGQLKTKHDLDGELCRRIETGGIHEANRIVFIAWPACVGRARSLRACKPHRLCQGHQGLPDRRQERSARGLRQADRSRLHDGARVPHQGNDEGRQPTRSR